MVGYIYIHTSPSGKSYIGQTIVGLKSRWDSGYGYGAKTIFGKAIKKYGWNNFTHEVLYTIEGESAEKIINILNQLEVAEILSRNTMAPNGYNGTLGGRNRLLTEYQKELISQSLKGRELTGQHKENIAKALVRRWEDPSWRESFSAKMKEKHTDKNFTRKRSEAISKALKGRKMSDEWKKKMSESAKKRWANQDERNKASERMKNGQRKRNTSGRFIKETDNP